ncbi:MULTISPECIES: hypothetical protein [Falsihalocynthiibacter]|uniref:hypothetical protein n=1 Tax=Falsihalocynthiibacter TaxID=2854182 RepID=UPI0030034092
MNALSLVKIRIKEGYWEGILTSDKGDSTPPQVLVTHLEAPLEGVEVIAQHDTSNEWLLRIAIPIELLSDGVHTFLIFDKDEQALLDSFSIVAGEPLSQDIRAEMNLLREELDMLKRAFRRHCVETAP